MFILKGQSNEFFGLPVFSSLEPAWATYHWVKIFPILVMISLSYSNFCVKKWGYKFSLDCSFKQNKYNIFLLNLEPWTNVINVIIY